MYSCASRAEPRAELERSVLPVPGMNICHIVRRTFATFSIIALLFAVACSDKNSNSTTGPSGCQIITGTTTTTFPASGGSASITVATPNTCTWTATSNASFLTITQGASGAGNGTVQFAVAQNTGPVRVATLTITGTAITITQQAPSGL